MSKKLSYDPKKVLKPPEGGRGWAWLTVDLLESPSWRRRSIHCARLIEFLIIEHIADKGQGNGHLHATFNQLSTFGISRRYIPAAIAEAEALKLIVAQHGGKRAYRRAAMTTYRLTFYGSRQASDDGNDYFVAATNDWKKVTEADIRAYRTTRPSLNPHRQKKKNAGASGDTDSVQRVN